MKRAAAGTRKSAASAPDKGEAPGTPKARIHPVVIYPFRQPTDYSDLEALYSLIGQLNSKPETYSRPLTVMDRKTLGSMEGNAAFREFRQNTVARHSDILDAWCVDTCQMWYTGLGAAFDKGGGDDIYWLIPGDFDYGTPSGRRILERLHFLPEIVGDLKQDFCIGEILTDHTNSKQLIDTYGTFALLYNWFPFEARLIREVTERPRSEFFAIRRPFLREVLNERWYAYEQTVVMLLKAVSGKKRISRFFVGDISDVPGGRESLSSAMQQVERTERVLKTLWRERNEAGSGWYAQYRALETESEQILRTSMTILHNLLV